jgi:hypothetical protein
MSWEVDWTHPENTGTNVLARNPNSHVAKCREWHMVGTGYLRSRGLNTPIFRKDSWEVDWARRDGKKVWARNSTSKMPEARKWHWVDATSLRRGGIAWKPKNGYDGRRIDNNGYVVLTRRAMTSDEIALAEEFGLFRGGRQHFVKEHQLVAVKKYGQLPSNSVVRHLNGIKSDNRPENLVLGTTQENTMDHNTARLMAMYWREKYESLVRML